MNRLTQLVPFRTLTSIQWIMLSAIIAISSFMVLASEAEARDSYLYPISKAQTISHCGLLNTRPVIYGKYRRPYSDQRNTRIIQGKLETLGYTVGRPGVDGKYGPLTRRAVMNFQDDNALRIDGVVGIETSRVLAYVSHPINNVHKCKRPVRMSYLD